MGYYPRTAGPAKIKKYKQEKTRLSIEFRFQCAFCDTTEFSFGSFRNFHVEHFRPKSLPEFSHLICDWSNLYYSCGDCNACKGPFWPSPELEARGYVLVDPSKEDVFKDDIKIMDDGSPKALTDRGKCMIEIFHFAERTEVKTRWGHREVLAKRIAKREAILAGMSVLSTVDNPELENDRREVTKMLEEAQADYRLYFLGFDTRVPRGHWRRGRHLRK